MSYEGRTCWEDQRDDAGRHARQLEVERDAARAEVERLRAEVAGLQDSGRETFVRTLQGCLAEAESERDRLRAVLADTPGLEAYAQALRDLIPLARGHAHAHAQVTTGNHAEDRRETEMAEARIRLSEDILERADAALRARAGQP